MSEPLKPCPFCGGTDIREYFADEVSYHQCNDCTALGPDNCEGLNWNTRTALAAGEARPVADMPAVVQVPQGLIEAVDRVLEEAHCDCPQRLRFDDGQHLSGCPLFDLNVARLAMLAAAPPPAAPVKVAPTPEAKDDALDAPAEPYPNAGRHPCGRTHCMRDDCHDLGCQNPTGEKR